MGDASRRRQFVTTWLQVRRLRSPGRGAARPVSRPCPRNGHERGQQDAQGAPVSQAADTRWTAGESRPLAARALAVHLLPQQLHRMAVPLPGRRARHTGLVRQRVPDPQVGQQAIYHLRRRPPAIPGLGSDRERRPAARRLDSARRPGDLEAGHRRNRAPDPSAKPPERSSLATCPMEPGYDGCVS
jgi:hypothetical protein